MLWRERYDTRVQYDVEAVPITGTALSAHSETLSRGHIVLGAFSPEGYMGMGVWLRLIEAEYGIASVRLVFFDEAWSSDEREDLALVIPKSLQNRTLLCSTGAEFWRETVEPDHPGRAFAALLSDSGVRCLMIGPPTEERWDEFQAAVQSSGN